MLVSGVFPCFSRVVLVSGRGASDGHVWRTFHQNVAVLGYWQSPKSCYDFLAMHLATLRASREHPTVERRVHSWLWRRV